jgi:sugar lactone lactonase YvrE
MMTRRLLALAIFIPACGGSQPAVDAAPPPPPPPPPAAPEPVAAPAAANEPKPAEAPKPSAPTPIVRYTEGFSTPESVLYDDAADRYLVSNIEGKPWEADGKGYIAELSPDGKVTNPKFIAAGTKDVKLNAPKGMAIVQGVLYVTDITTVRKFDAKTGAPKGEIPIAGTSFLNDIAAAPDGRIFVSDTGIKANFEPSGADAVYVIDKGKAKPLAKAKDLGGPNGLLPVANGLLVVSFGSGELYRLDEKGARQDITKLPEGGLDGITLMGDNLLISSWTAKAVFRGKLGGKFESVIPNVESPADIGYDTKRSRVIIPRFMSNAVEAYEIK